MSTRHSTLTGINLHEPFHYVQEGDPGSSNANKYWLKISTGELKRRKADDTGWNLITGGAASSPMTNSGDMIYGGVAGVPARLPKGANGQLLSLAAGIPVWQNEITNQQPDFMLMFQVQGGDHPVPSGASNFGLVPSNCTLLSWYVVADQVGSIAFDVYAGLFNVYPSVQISGVTDKPTLTAGKAASGDVTSAWSATTFVPNEVFYVNVTSAATNITYCTVALKFRRT